jgi:hypothetical protein
MGTRTQSAVRTQAADMPKQETSSAARSQRRFPRYVLDVRFTIEVFRDGEKVHMWGRSNEMGQDGIGGTLTAKLEPGEVVWLELPLPRMSTPLRIRAIVRYQAGLRHGFEFLTLTSEQKTGIMRVCEMLAAQQ